jgi:hypothetical protein
MSVATNKEQGRTIVLELVQAFQEGRGSFIANEYKEAQLRSDFLNPFLKAFGWDVENEAHASQFYRTVLQEESIGVEEESGNIRKKNPDYTLRVNGKRELFVEAKKARIDILTSKPSAFQTRRYGWSAGINASVLTNFDNLVIYDCTFQPRAEDDAPVARYFSFNYLEYVDRFDEIYDLLSYEAVVNKELSQRFEKEDHQTISFDEAFLAQIQSWRILIAENITHHNAGLSDIQLNLLVQSLINRIVFLRICEDREIEKKDVLKNITTYDELKALFIESDKRYNSGLFDFIEDELSLGIRLDDELIIEIFSQLYFPYSPYDFAVVDSSILSQIYEYFLGQRISITEGSGIKVTDDEQVIASNGVVPTPSIIVDEIVRSTLTPLIEGKTLAELQTLHVADICCGSGTFLIGAYNILLQAYSDRIISENIEDPRFVRLDQYDVKHLTLEAKRGIILQNIWGVDINRYAVEVARFSLLLKILEGEEAATVDQFIASSREQALPNLSSNIKSGNSLVDSGYFDFDETINTDEILLYKINPFDWSDEFEFLQKTGGFDAIIGNPPYVRIQNLQEFFSEEIRYYRKSEQAFVTAKESNIDKYYFFIERGLQLIKDDGLLGYIVPHKFFVLTAGKRLRNYIRVNSSIRTIIHFGTTQVFKGKSTYTAILVLQKSERDEFDFKRVHQDGLLTSINVAAGTQYSNSEFGTNPWVFVSDLGKRIFAKVNEVGTVPLITIADIPVGLQTSADPIYVLTKFTISGDTTSFKRLGANWQIETTILRDCLYDASFSLFDKPKSNAKIIYPYEVLPDGTTAVIQEDRMQRDFPLCWAYFNAHKAALERRSIGGGREDLQTWYQYGRSQSLSKFNDTNKLIWSVLAQGAPYGFDTNNLLFTGGGNGPYYSLITTSDYSIFYFLAILSHPVIEAMVQSGASEFRGAYYSHGKQFLKRIPIKTIDFDVPDEKAKHDNIVALVEQLIEGRERIKETAMTNRPLIRRQSHLHKRLISLVDNLYGLTSDETKSIINQGVFAVNTNEDEE